MNPNHNHNLHTQLLVAVWLLLAATDVRTSPSGQATTFGARAMPNEPGTTIYTNLSAGFDHSLAIRNDGTVMAWGNNFSGQCSVPASLSNVVAVAAGSGRPLNRPHRKPRALRSQVAGRAVATGPGMPLRLRPPLR